MSTSSKSSPNKKVQQLLVDIQNGDTSMVIKALKALEAHGNTSALEPLMYYWKNVTDASVDHELGEFFAALKDTDSRHPIMKMLEEEEDSEFRIKLLTAIWNCKVDYSDYLAEFVQIAADGTFMEALECLTIIENLDGPFEEEQFFESQIALKSYLDQRKNGEDQKAQLMSEIAVIIKDLESNDINF